MDAYTVYLLIIACLLFGGVAIFLIKIQIDLAQLPKEDPLNKAVTEDEPKSQKMNDEEDKGARAISISYRYPR